MDFLYVVNRDHSSKLPSFEKIALLYADFGCQNENKCCHYSKPRWYSIAGCCCDDDDADEVMIPIIVNFKNHKSPKISKEIYIILSEMYK